MKRIMENLFGTFAISVIGFGSVACTVGSDDPGDEPGKNLFPELQEVTVETGKTSDVTFTVAAEWTMESDCDWVRFLTGEEDKTEERAIVYGDAGENTVKLSVKDFGHQFYDETADLRMTVAGSTETVIRVTRPAKGRVMQMLAGNIKEGPFSPVDVIEFKYNESQFFGFEGNFDWKIIESPDWLGYIKNITGKAGAVLVPEKTDEKKLDKDAMDLKYLPFEQTGNIVISTAAQSDVRYTFPVEYSGMGVQDNIIEPLWNYGVYFNNDGYHTEYSPVAGTPPVPTDDKFVTAIHLCKGNDDGEIDRTIVFIEAEIVKNGNAYSVNLTELTQEESWVKCSSDPKSSEIEISVDAFEQWTDRTMYVYFLPPYYKSEEYDFNKDFKATWNGKDITFSSQYGRKIVQFAKQRTEGFEMTTYNASWEEITLPAPEKVTDPYLIAEYGTENIYAHAFTRDEWSATTMAITVDVFGFNGYPMTDENQQQEQEKWFKTFGQKMNSFTIGSRVPYDNLPATGNYHIKVMDSNNKVFGVLIISKAE